MLNINTIPLLGWIKIIICFHRLCSKTEGKKDSKNEFYSSHYKKLFFSLIPMLKKIITEMFLDIVQNPIVGAPHIIDSIGIRKLWGFSIVERKNGYIFDLIGPLSGISLMRERAHANEASTMDMNDNLFKIRFKSLFFSPKTTASFFV